MRVVALVPGGIGDQLLFFPTLDKLKQIYPEAQIDVVVEPRSMGAYRVCKSVAQVFRYDFKDRNGPADWSNLLGILRDREYEIVISLGQRMMVGLLLWMTGIPVRVGYAGPGSRFLTNPVPLKTDQYAANMYHDLLQGLNITSGCPPISIKIPAGDLDWGDAEKKRLGITGKYILLHGGSSQLAISKGIDKIYPVSKWSVVIREIQEKQPSLPIVVVKGPEDAGWVKELILSCPGCKVTSPDDIGKLAAMIAGTNLMLCTDSGPMHLGVSLGINLIALFGPTNAQKLLPPSDRFIPIQSRTAKISDITPEEILQRIWQG